MTPGAAMRAAALAAAFLLPTMAGGAEPPPDLAETLAAAPSRRIEASFADERRASAMRSAALGYGARAGLARRGWEIDRMLGRRAAQLSRVFRFRDLLLDRGGFSVMPPVASETLRAFRLGRDGARAAAARRVVRLVAPERLVGAAPDWRDYLIRRWAAAEAPASVLYPRNAAERGRWVRWVSEGWSRGVGLADDIFAADLDRLMRDFEGIVLWRRLHLARMATAPAVTVEDADVSGGGKVMRIGETFARLGEPARLVPRASRWRLLPEAGP